MSNDGAQQTTFNGKKITNYNCSNCCQVNDALKSNSLRPNNKFCDRDCMAFTIDQKIKADEPLPKNAKAWLSNYQAESLPEKCYSLNGDEFEDLDSLNDSIELAGFNPGDEVTIFEAEPVHFNHADFIHVGTFIEDMQDRAYDHGGQFADDYLSNVTPEIEAELKNLIGQFLDRRVGKPTFYEVKNVNETVITFNKQVSKNG